MSTTKPRPRTRANRLFCVAAALIMLAACGPKPMTGEGDQPETTSATNKLIVPFHRAEVTDTVALTASADAEVDHVNPDQYFGQNSDMRLRSKVTAPSGQVTYESRGLVRFNNTAIRNAVRQYDNQHGSAAIVEAKLLLYVKVPPTSYVDVGLRRLNTNFVEAYQYYSSLLMGVTWNCRMDADALDGNNDCAYPWTLDGSATQTQASWQMYDHDYFYWGNKRIEFHVKNEIDEVVSQNATHHGWSLEAGVWGNILDSVLLHTREATSSSDRPKLLLEVCVPQPESCDWKDSNCDGDLVDGFADFDKDGAPDCIDSDDDNDGSPDTLDCRDNDATSYPGAPETCDGIDHNCDGRACGMVQLPFPTFPKKKMLP